MLPSSRPLSHTWETSIGSETSCRKSFCCSNVEHRCRTASSTADVWKARRCRDTQTFTAKTQRQPGSCPTDRTRWCEKKAEAHKVTAQGCTPRWLNKCVTTRMDEQHNNEPQTDVTRHSPNDESSRQVPRSRPLSITAPHQHRGPRQTAH